MKVSICKPPAFLSRQDKDFQLNIWGQCWDLKVYFQPPLLCNDKWFTNLAHLNAAAQV